MKITCDTLNLSKALDTVQRAAQNKVTSNTNNGFYISASEGHIEFQANDYSIGIKTTCHGIIEEEGTVVIASPYLSEMIRRLPEYTVTLEQKSGENLIRITSGKTKYSLPIKNTDDFPLIQEIDHTNCCTIPNAVMKDMINLTQYAVSTDKQKPLFTGILFEIKENNFTMTATNTHQLAAKEVSLEELAKATGRFIVPSGVLSEVARLLPVEDDGKVEISWARSHVAFTFGDTYFLSTLISGEYPDWHRIIPSQFITSVTLSLKDFSDAVGRVALLARNTEYKKINFLFENDAVRIFGEDRVSGEAEDNVPAKVEGEPAKVIFNCFYIEDILKHSRGDTVTLHIPKAGPMLVEQEEDKQYTYVVTPMRG